MAKDRKAKVNALPDGNKNSVFRFGIGWWPILYCFLMFYMYVGMVNDGTNVVAPAISAALGVEMPQVLFCNFIAGVIGIVFYIVFGTVNRKIGPRKLSGILMIIVAIAYFGVGQSVNLVMYTICMAFVVGSVMTAGYICGGTLVAQWFPKKKGAVMGLTTAGHNTASACFVAIIAATTGAMTIRWGLLPMCIGCLIIAILGLVFMRDTPFEYGINPDNVSDKVYAEEYDTEDTAAADDDGGWTVGKLLTTKETWMSSVTTGLFQVCSAGIMTQIVLRNVELGMSQGQALALMTVVALIGIVGSWLIGIIDTKIGTKKTMMGFGVWYGIALLFNFATTNYHQPTFWISVVMIGMSIGGSANFTTSLPTACFGRHGFAKVNSVVFPIQGAITACNYLVNMFVQAMTGGVIRYAYLVLAIVSFVNIILIATVNEHRFNRDWMAEQEAKKAEEAAA